MKRYAFFLLVLLATVSCSNSGTPSESASQAVEDIIMSRRSVRKYLDRTVSREILDEILYAGINAPNGQNRQAYEVRVVDDRDFLEAVSSAVLSEGSEVATPRSATGGLFFNAPCVVFIANDTSYDMSQVDCGLLGENLILSAWSRGIGSCCLAGPVRQMKASEACAPLIRQMGFSEGYNLLYCISLGYPDESPAAKPRKTEKIRYVE